MKDKILYLILGILVGAIITSLIFIFVVKDDTNVHGGKMEGMENMERGERPDDMGNFIMDENMVMPEMKEGKEPSRGGDKTSSELPEEKE